MPLAWLLAFKLNGGINGVLISIPVADALVATTAVILFVEESGSSSRLEPAETEKAAGTDSLTVAARSAAQNTRRNTCYARQQVPRPLSYLVWIIYQRDSRIDWPAAYSPWLQIRSTSSAASACSKAAKSCGCDPY